MCTGGTWRRIGSHGTLAHRMTETTAAALAPLQAALGYQFVDLEHLRTALVHTSYVNERPERTLASNERLEFLGDAILGAIVAHRLFEARPESPEGELTVLRAWLVRQSTLARWARDINLGAYVLLGRGEVRGGGRERPAILARAYESVLGAIYLDGGLDAVRSVVDPRVDLELTVGFTPQKVVDAKSRLQQVTQSRFETTPVYHLLEYSGPGHAPVFEFEVEAGPEVRAHGTGSSKRVAQQAAAHAALQMLQVTEGYEQPI